MAAKRSSRLRFAQTAAYKMSRSVSRVLLSSGHLSRRTVAGTLQPPRERPGKPNAPISVLLRIEFTAADAFTRRRVSSYLAFPPLPRQRKLRILPLPQATGRTHFAAFPLPTKTAVNAGAPKRGREAVSLCCTFPQIALGGRYPLSLPCGARTFLMDRLSPLSPRPSNLLINIIV